MKAARGARRGAAWGGAAGARRVRPGAATGAQRALLPSTSPQRPRRALRPCTPWPPPHRAPAPAAPAPAAGPGPPARRWRGWGPWAGGGRRRVARRCRRRERRQVGQHGAAPRPPLTVLFPAGDAMESTALASGSAMAAVGARCCYGRGAGRGADLGFCGGMLLLGRTLSSHCQPKAATPVSPPHAAVRHYRSPQDPLRSAQRSQQAPWSAARRPQPPAARRAASSGDAAPAASGARRGGARPGARPRSGSGVPPAVPRCPGRLCPGGGHPPAQAGQGAGQGRQGEGEGRRPARWAPRPCAPPPGAPRSRPGAPQVLEVKWADGVARRFSCELLRVRGAGAGRGRGGGVQQEARARGARSRRPAGAKTSRRRTPGHEPAPPGHEPVGRERGQPLERRPQRRAGARAARPRRGARAGARGRGAAARGHHRRRAGGQLRSQVQGEGAAPRAIGPHRRAGRGVAAAPRGAALSGWPPATSPTPSVFTFRITLITPP
jgi:hypothetical protein